MKSIIQADLNPDIYYPLETVVGEDGKLRVGGTPPQGIIPKLNNARYFATLSLKQSDELQISVFLCFGFDTMFDEAFRIVGSEDALVEIVAHKYARRGDSAQFRSELSPCDLKVLEGKKEDRAAPYGYSKLGGCPFLIREKNNLSTQIAGMLSGGFVHHTQLAFPLTGDVLHSGNWPFADGIFHLFVKQQQSSFDWRCFWQYES